MRYYLIGIKGSGMSALAKILINMKHEVIGSDVSNHYYTEDGLDNVIINDFDIKHLSNDYVYIIGNAFIDSKIVQYIKKKDYEYYTYPKFLVKLFKNHKLLCVSGTHGKTTTSKMLATMIEDCAYLIGDGSGKNGKDYFVLEACEYKDTFLNYYPDIAIITNIDYDHPDYFKTKKNYYDSFVSFSKQSKLVILNGDSANINGDNIITYGMKDDNDIIFSINYLENSMNIEVLDEKLNIPLIGEHFAYDFVGAFIAARLLEIPVSEIKEKISDFSLPKRRMKKKKYDYDIYLDYAHHPNEIECVYKTIKLNNNKKLICIFQPHTISRTKSFLENFKKSLNLFDKVYLLPIFTSIREKIDKKMEDELYKTLNFERIDSLDYIKFEPQNSYIFLGAGDIDERLIKRINKIN